MKRLVSPAAVFAALFLALVLVRPCLAAGVEGASVTIYNSGRALVGETRSVNLPKGPAEVVFRNIPDTVDPTSVSATAEGMAVTGLEYRYTPITRRTLLDRYVGKELSVILPDPANGDGRILRKAVLLSGGDQPVFQVGNEVYLGDALAYLLPKMPEGVDAEPTLALRTENAAAARRAIRLRYLMGGLTWRADYTLVLDAAGKAGSLEGWATVENTSACDFRGATLKLVAGDVRQATGPVLRKGMVMVEAAMAADNAPAPESFAQFHVYAVPGSVDLASGGTRQIGLLDAPKVAVAEELECRMNNGVRQLSGPEKQVVNLSLRLVNVKADGLGMPLPAGQVRAYRPTRDNSLLLMGEASLDHTGVGDTAVLPMGSAFDVTVTRTQTEFTRLGKQSYRLGWSLAVTNGRPAPQPLVIVDNYRGEWQVLNADHDHTRPDASGLRFDVTAPPTPDGKPLRINYTVQVTY